MNIKNNYLIPIVIEKNEYGERSYDIYSRLMIDRIVMLGTAIDDTVANIIIAQLLFLHANNDHKPIHIYINSPGGSVSAGLAIYDTMRFVKPEIHTYCLGMAASMGAVLLAAGTKRIALPHSRIMIHQPSGGFQGQATDISIQAKEILHIREELNQILSVHTKQPIDKIQRDTERDNFMSPEEALKYGLIDEVVKSTK